MQEPILAESDSAAAKPTVEASPSEGVRRFSVARLLAALVLLIIALPIVENLEGGMVIEGVLLTLVLLLAVPAIGASSRTHVMAIVLVTPAVGGKWLDHWKPDLVPNWAFVGPMLVFLAFVVVHLLSFIFRARVVDLEVLCAGVSGFLMIGILWAATYVLVAEIHPQSFAFSAGAAGGSMRGFNAIYFSFVNLSGVGFGDIVPMSRAARALAMVEAMSGMFYMAILIARLVSLYSSEKGKTT